MRRRRYLRLTAAAGIAGTAGCSLGYQRQRTGAAADVGPDAGPTGGELDLPVPREEMLRAASPDGIPAITDPAFDVDWSGLSVTTENLGVTYETEPRLRADDPVVGVARDGSARAYPLKVLNWHEVVNDAFGGPLLVTYCPLCRSGVTAVRRTSAGATRFGVSGLLWRHNLVLYDEATGSLWSQIAATAINGDLTGETLEIVPSTLATWAEWRRDHPDTLVLRPPPESGTLGGPSETRDYRQNPYADYQASDAIGVSDGAAFDDGRLHPKTEVLGIANDGAARAYPVDRVQREGVVDDEVGGLPVVVTSIDGTATAYVREVGGEVLEFSPAGPRRIEGGGSRWLRATGEATAGERAGARLARATDVSPLFWFAWLDFHPNSTVYGDADG